jgi:acetyl-CoA acetyltransferase
MRARAPASPSWRVVAVAAREWAKLNPKAFLREDLTVEDVLSSHPVSSPLSVRDCCLVTDGGRDGRREGRGSRTSPVFLLGSGESHWHRNMSQMPDLTVSAAAESGPRAYAMSEKRGGVKRRGKIRA